MKDLPRPPVYDYEVAFSGKEIISALLQDAVNHNRLPSGIMLDATFSILNDDGFVSIILKVNKSDKIT